MTASITSPEDVVNLALTRIGYKIRVTNLYEGSAAANAALNIYAQTRDALIRDGEWDFAERAVSMTLLKHAPPGGYVPPTVWNPATNPPVPWMFEYTYPSDCLKVRAVKAVPFFIPNFDPQPHVFSEDNDATFSPPQRVILCNVPNAVLTYAGQVVDPQTWTVDFIEVFADALGKLLAPALTNLDNSKMMGAEEQLQGAMTTQVDRAGH